MLIPPLVLLQHNNNFRDCHGNPRRGGAGAATRSWNATWDRKSTTSEAENSQIVPGVKETGLPENRSGEASNLALRGWHA